VINNTRRISAAVARDDPRVGRPRGSSRQMLQEAASELFLEQTYARTTIEQIAHRAGVSRNTFFNYFQTKSDLLWVEIDDSLSRLPDALERGVRVYAERSATDAVRVALLSIAAEFGPGRVPWALTQQELMGTSGELAASALSRFSEQAHLVNAAVARRIGIPADNLLCGSFATAVLAAAASAAVAWAAAGVNRGNLAPWVDTAITPLCDGYRTALATAPRHPA
jgi:AcrR family transcriptional regulator